MSATLTVTRELTDRFCSDVLTTAFDGDYGACWYWAEPWSDDEHGQLAPAWTLDPRGDGDELDRIWRAVRIVEIDGVEDEPPSITVDHAAIARGIARLLDPDFEVAPDIRQAVATLNADDIDAPAADCIVQAACFGEIVYG